MTRELFVYWRTDADVVAAALEATRGFQAGLGLTQPGVQCRLYQRISESDGSVTLMETYASAGGLAGAQLAELLAAASQALAGWARGERHVEVFDRLPG